jgi:lipopolysaccharide/colanic/teichoic acid biosynthesis glycosyltransferase
VTITDDNLLIVLHETRGERERSCLASVLANEPLCDMAIDLLLARGHVKRICLAVPAAWGLKTNNYQRNVVRYSNYIPLASGSLNSKSNSYLILSNGRFYTNVDYSWLRNVVLSLNTDVVMVNVEPTLSAGCEKLRLTSGGQLAGIRRIYSDSAQKTLPPTDWPCWTFINKSVLQGIFKEDAVSSDFNSFISIASKYASITSISVGGAVLDIETPQGMRAFVMESLKALSPGEAVIGRNVRMGENVKLISPLIICDNADIGDGAIIAKAVIGSGVKVCAGEAVFEDAAWPGMPRSNTECRTDVFDRPASNFRLWPRLSYAGFAKRYADILVATAVLILFAPVIAIIALMVKATSRGPVFFNHIREGLHGKNFHCLKFRSMIVGADELQTKLRMKNEVDGPQFKMGNDPRVTSLGRFLRDTYLDEIPQFFNVLIGNMSVIGPRPSPEMENSLCAYWRDARLSVRPGITGLWQVCRTRKAGSDFQEWVHYDSQYVRMLSLKLDAWIFWKTIVHLIKAFMRQF